MTMGVLINGPEGVARAPNRRRHNGYAVYGQRESAIFTSRATTSSRAGRAPSANTWMLTLRQLPSRWRHSGIPHADDADVSDCDLQ